MPQKTKQSRPEGLDKQLNEARKHAAQQLQVLTDRSNRPRIYPPDKLLYSNDFKSSDYKAAVQPYWDPITLELQIGGYRDVLRLLGRLKRRKKLADRNTSYARQVLYGWKMLRFIFRSEAGMHGLDTTLVESLSTEPASSDQDHWIWAISNKGIPGKIEYQVTANVGLKTSYEEAELPVFFRAFPGDMTWKDVLDLIAEHIEIETGNYNSKLGQSTTIDFRMEVIQAVLWEYEVLGYAPLFDEAEFKESKQPSREMLDFIEKGLLLYIDDKFKEDALCQINSRDGLISKTMEELGLLGDPSGLRSQLITHGLYNKQTKTGRPPKKDEFPLLKDMIKIWVCALKRWDRWDKIKKIHKDVDLLHF